MFNAQRQQPKFCIIRFPFTRSRLCVIVLSNTLDHTRFYSNERESRLAGENGLPVKTEYEGAQKSKKQPLKGCPNHINRDFVS